MFSMMEDKIKANYVSSLGIRGINSDNNLSPPLGNDLYSENKMNRHYS